MIVRPASPLLPLAFTLVTSCLVAQDPVRESGRPEERDEPEQVEAEETPLGEAATRAVLTYYERSEDWPIRVLSLLRLGTHWHPIGAPIVAEALEERDVRLRVYALEALLRTRPDVLRAVATEDLIDALIKLAKRGGKEFEAPTLELFQRIATDGEIEDRRDFERWWRVAKKADYRPAEWPAIPEQKGDEEESRTTSGVIEKALDLKESGLDLAIVIDATGSMGGPIAACTGAMDDLIELLGELAPKFRAGVVVYRDFGDMSDGAGIEVELKPYGKDAQKKLSRLVPSGGGDVPERVEKGFELAISREMRWRPEANKLVLIVGDAPPHAETQEALVALVRKAHDDPASILLGGPVTGEHQIKPFLTSCIAAHEQAKEPFEAIAEAGGGAFAQLRTEGRGSDSASRQIAGHVLRLSFGARWKSQADLFAKIYFEWRDREVFR